MSEDDPIATYARALAAIDPDDVPIAAAGERLADTVAAFLAARPTGEAQRLCAAAGVAAALPEIPLAFAGTVRLSELDDIHLPTCVTASAIVVPAALAALAHGGDGPALRRALAAGYATAIRFAAGLGGVEALREGVWPTLTVAPIAAAAAAAAARGLDAAAIADALRIAALHGTPRIGRAPQPSARWYLFGAAVSAGIAAAAAAAAGLRADSALPAAPLLGLDDARRAIGDGEIDTMAQKPFCSSRQAASGVAAFLELVARERVPPDAIARVCVEVPRAYGWMISGDPRPGERLSTLTSQRFQIAAAALDPPLLVDVERGGPFDPALAAFGARVEIVETDAFDRLFPTCWPAGVRIALYDGTEHAMTVERPLGDPGRPLGFAHLQAKSPAFTAEIDALARAAPSAGPATLLAALRRSPVPDETNVGG